MPEIVPTELFDLRFVEDPPPGRVHVVERSSILPRKHQPLRPRGLVLPCLKTIPRDLVQRHVSCLEALGLASPHGEIPFQQFNIGPLEAEQLAAPETCVETHGHHGLQVIGGGHRAHVGQQGIPPLLAPGVGAYPLGAEAPLPFVQGRQQSRVFIFG